MKISKEQKNVTFVIQKGDILGKNKTFSAIADKMVLSKKENFKI